VNEIQQVLVQTRLLSLLVTVIRRYHENLPPMAREYKQGASTIVEFVGGGGDDVRAATAAVETCLRLSFIVDSDDEFQAKFAAPELGLEALLENVLALPAPRQLGDETRQAAKLLLGRYPDPDGGTENETPSAPKRSSIRSIASAAADGDNNDTDVPSPSSAAAPMPPAPSAADGGGGRGGAADGPPAQHVMLSYAWAAKKDLVVALGNALGALGYDVWRDELGSDVVPPMSGDTDDRMAEAIEASHAVVICVSPQYKESFNCRSEAKYCQSMKKNHGLKLLYVMMDDGYTTVSKGRTVDGWLGFMVGGELWYPMWSADKVAGTAAELAKALGDNARSLGRGRLYETLRASEKEATAHRPVASSSSSMAAAAAATTKAAAAAATAAAGGGLVTTSASAPLSAVAVAWGMVQDPTKIKDPSRLARMLAEHGVSEPEDLAVLADDRALCEDLARCLKTAPAKRVLLLLGLG